MEPSWSQRPPLHDSGMGFLDLDTPPESIILSQGLYLTAFEEALKVLLDARKAPGRLQERSIRAP